MFELSTVAGLLRSASAVAEDGPFSVPQFAPEAERGIDHQCPGLHMEIVHKFDSPKGRAEEPGILAS